MNAGAARPIVIAEYDPAWERRFQEERAMLYRACGRDAFVRIEHVGSTAVPGLAAKPIIDIMPGVRSLDDFAKHIPAIESLGWRYGPETERPRPELSDPGMPFRRYFRKFVDGTRVGHMHTVEFGSDFWRDHLMFRNYLRMHPADARAYADLKRSLANSYNHTMLADNVHINLGYTEFKTEFIESIRAKARARIEKSAPIVIVPYNPLWSVKFEREREAIEAAIGDIGVAIEHVGSSSVPGLAAKPTIDIAIGVRTMDEARGAIEPLLALGYAKGVDAHHDWLYFDRDGHEPAENVHLHFVPFGGERWHRYLLFRDYLRTHPDAAAAYERTKRELAAEFNKDRLGYVEGKTEFIEHISFLARSS